MKVEIWSDVVCPWCYIGKRRFEQAMAAFAHRDGIEVEWKAFELDPTSTSAQRQIRREPATTPAASPASYGTDRRAGPGMIDDVAAAARSEGLDFHFERAVRANTVLRASGHPPGRPAGRAGRGEGAAVARVLHRGRGRRRPARPWCASPPKQVLTRRRSDRIGDARLTLTTCGATSTRPRQLGISGVPFFVIDRKYGVSGAQPPEALLQVLEQAWNESHPVPPRHDRRASDGDACGPDGCAV